MTSYTSFGSLTKNIITPLLNRRLDTTKNVGQQRCAPAFVRRRKKCLALDAQRVESERKIRKLLLFGVYGADYIFLIDKWNNFDQQFSHDYWHQYVQILYVIAITGVSVSRRFAACPSTLYSLVW